MAYKKGVPVVKILQGYYPFGLTYQVWNKSRSAGESRYKYNNKEEQKEWQVIDFNTRMYDAVLGRFQGIDMLSEKYALQSPYAYAVNNPVKYVDVLGMGPGDDCPWGCDRSNDPIKEASQGMVDAIVSTAETAWFLLKAFDPTKKVSAERAQLVGGIANIVSDPLGTVKTGLANVKKSVDTYMDSSPYEQRKMQNELMGSLVIGIFAEKGAGKILEGSGVLRLADDVPTSGKGSLIPCGCFLPSTTILTDKGNKKIQDIKEGDLVYAFDDETDEKGLKEVVNTFSKVRDHIYRIYFKGEVIEATNDHPFYIGGRWLKVEELSEGDQLSLYNGKKVAIDSILYEKGSFEVFNFEVADYHTYYVSSKNVLVHNSGPCDSFGPSGTHSAIKNKWGDDLGGVDLREIQNTIDRIKTGDASVYPAKDGTLFQNSHTMSPNAQRLNTSETYSEWTVKTPGVGGRGSRRIVVSEQTGRAYYSHDHYNSYIEIDLSKF